jgi:hypothetical protein
LKGEERVCHVTEADAPGANALDVSEEVSSCEAAVRVGLAPVRGGFVRRFLAETPGIKRKKGHLVDALALRGDEGRGTLRKARGRCERSVIPGSPNGATHPARGITI